MLKWKRMEGTYGLRAVDENTGTTYEIMRLEHALLDVQMKHGWVGCMLTVKGDSFDFFAVHPTQKECKQQAEGLCK